MMNTLNFATVPFSVMPPKASMAIPMTISKHKNKLPSDFLPGKYTVLCGRGKVCSSSPGNKYLRSLVNSHLDPYSKAKNKVEKSNIVSAIIDAVREKAPIGAFVKQDRDGTWWEVEDTFAREKIGCIFRDILHTQYRSSTKAKFARKKAQKKDENSRSSSFTSLVNFSGQSGMYSGSYCNNQSMNHSFVQHRPSIVSLSSIVQEQDLSSGGDDFDPLPLVDQQTPFEQMQHEGYSLGNKELLCMNPATSCEGNNSDFFQQQRLHAVVSCDLSTKNTNYAPQQQFRPPQPRRLDILRNFLPHPLPRSENIRGTSRSTASLVRDAFEIINIPPSVIPDSDVDFPDDLSGIFED